MLDLQGKTAVVTGAASGIGEALVRAFSAEGMNVVVADVSAGGAERVAADLRAAGRRALGVHVDVASREAVRALAERAYAEFGHVHVLCNNAGVNVYSPFLDLQPADWDWIMGINFMGVVHGAEAFVPRMLTQGGEAHIVNTASVAGITALESGTISAYTATKHAVFGFSDSLRLELARHGIGVSTLCPGQIKTNIRSAGRYAASVASRRPPDDWIDDPRIDAALVPPMVIAGIRENARYIFTDQEHRPYLEARCAAMMAAFDRAAAWGASVKS